ncbi:MAG: GNAT family N-acetyltransferase [Fimbriimonadaceae bacterium]|nr:GNAT family N-acetyltransferase [Alphaproteobacteria bacterium]
MSTIDIFIRPAKLKDAEAIAQAHNDAWRNAYSGIIPGKTLNHMISRRQSDWWCRAIRKNGADVLVLLFAGQVAGYASIRRNYQRPMQANSEVCELYLRPEYQGVGLGRRLLDAAIRAAAQKYGKGCIVWALRANEPACEFYRHLGGRPVAKATEKLGSAALEKIGFAWL